MRILDSGLAATEPTAVAHLRECVEIDAVMTPPLGVTAIHGGQTDGSLGAQAGTIERCFAPRRNPCDIMGGSGCRLRSEREVEAAGAQDSARRYAAVAASLVRPAELAGDCLLLLRAAVHDAGQQQICT
jgi:hypothetical protein